MVKFVVFCYSIVRNNNAISTVSDNSQRRVIIGHHARTQAITREDIHNYIYIQK